MPNELKPCPFCGAKAYFYNPMHNTMSVLCSGLECGATIFMYGKGSYEQIAERWNRRANDEQR